MYKKNKNYYYITKIEQIINNLIKQAKYENYYTNIRKQIYSIICIIQKNKEHDLKKFEKRKEKTVKQFLDGAY